MSEPTSRPDRRRSGDQGRPPGSAIDAAVRLLARRPHGREELSRKLRRRGHDPDEVEAAAVRATELGYLDDAAFARSLVRHRAAGRGAAAIAAELASRGVDRELAAQATSELTEDDQLAAAVRLAARALRGHATTPRQALETAGPKLLRRGFSPALARRACQKAWEAVQIDPSEGLL